MLSAACSEDPVSTANSERLRSGVYSECGNGIVDATEACDDAKTVFGDGYSET